LVAFVNVRGRISDLDVEFARWRREVVINIELASSTRRAMKLIRLAELYLEKAI